MPTRHLPFDNLLFDHLAPRIDSKQEVYLGLSLRKVVILLLRSIGPH